MKTALRSKSFLFSKSLSVLICFFLIAIFLWSRFYVLTEKPIHFDEGINGWFSEQMRLHGFYKYNPENFHGPLYFYLLNWSEWLFGESLFVLRLVPTVFGIWSVFLFLPGAVRGKVFAIAMMAFLGTSPAFIFFSRSGIHELPFVFFQLVFALGVHGWIEKPIQKNLILILIGLWGMALLKETFTILGLSLTLASLIMGPKFLQQVLSWKILKQLRDRNLSKVIFILVASFFLIYTGFLKNPAGAIDFFKAFLPWLKTGSEGNGHEKEFLYWLKVILTSEPLAFIGLVAAVWGVFHRTASRQLRFWSLVGLIQLMTYSLIPYKTVWCLVSIVWPFYFVLSQLINDGLIRSKKIQLLAAGLIAVGFAVSAKSTYDSSYKQPLDFTHPFIYVNSTYTVKDIAETLESSLVAKPELKNQLIQVGMNEQWPWPWVLRNFTNVNYQVCAKEVVADAAVYFCEAAESSHVESQLQEPYWKVEEVLRQTQRPVVVYFKKSLSVNPPVKTAKSFGEGVFK